jgi:hypothetical protein
MAVFITILILAVIVAAGAFTAYRWPHRVGIGPRLTPLKDGDEAYYLDSWTSVQGTFVDHPTMALTTADKLVTELLSARGYPVADQDALIAQLTRRHRAEVPGYQKAKETLRATGNGSLDTSTGPSTEDARVALIGFRTMSEELLTDAGATVPSRPAPGAAVAARPSAVSPSLSSSPASASPAPAPPRQASAPTSTSAPTAPSPGGRVSIPATRPPEAPSDR